MAILQPDLPFGVLPARQSVDPEQWMITVLGLVGEEYESLGCFHDGELASGRYFEGFVIDVSAVMALGDVNPTSI